jgi:hypothetical protein
MAVSGLLAISQLYASSGHSDWTSRSWVPSQKVMPSTAIIAARSIGPDYTSASRD